MKKIIGCFALLFACMAGCSTFPSKYENIEGTKTRPLAVVCEPAEAAPGDTVEVRFYYDSPVDSPDIRWTLSLDYETDLYGNEIRESNTVDLEGRVLPGATKDRFRFVVPESVLIQSTAVRNAFKQAPVLQGLDPARVDSALAAYRTRPDSLPSEYREFVDAMACKIKLRAKISTEIDLNVNKFLLIRYSRAYGTPGVNRNPRLGWIGMVCVRKADLRDPDSIGFYPNTLQFLYNESDRASVNDTVLIDTGCSYFLVADSGINGADTTLQSYPYFSLVDSTHKTGLEDYFYDWFYTNLDCDPSMAMDSLILLQGNRTLPKVSVLPPVKTEMRRFNVYTVLRDRRVNQRVASTGVAYAEVSGIFKFSEAYAEKYSGR